MGPTDLLILIVGLAFAGFAKGTTGMGLPLVATTILAGVFGPKAAVVIVTIPIFAAMQGVMVLTHRPPEVQLLVWILGLTQFVTMMNTSMAALLQANTTVDGLSVVNVASKVVWAAGPIPF